MFNRKLGATYAITMTFWFLVAVFYALRIPPAYTTDALLIPKEQNNSSSLSGLASATRLLGLGSLSQQSSNFDKFQKYWGSRDVAIQLLKQHPDLLMQLFRSEWDQSNNRWYDHPHQLRQYIAVPLNWLFGVYPSYAPSPENLADLIKNGMKLDIDALGGQMHITYSSSNALFAQWFLRTAISATDEAVRAAEQKRDQDFINFSRNRLGREDNVSYREALTDAVRQFEISNMYSEAGTNFSFQYVEAPNLPINHSQPRPLLYTVIAFIFANLVAASVTGAMALWPRSFFALRAGTLVDRIIVLFGIAKSKAMPGQQRSR
ncbi:MAG TPA: hypothetical protein VJQ06_12410 [Rhizomicrobium sp.]|nr:hypothetical protein [Rhizomicrobium sp.]